MLRNTRRISIEPLKFGAALLSNLNGQALIDIRKTYKRSVDQVGNYLVFNIKDYRLIVTVNFKAKIIWYKYLLNHKEYEKGNWKNG